MSSFVRSLALLFGLAFLPVLAEARERDLVVHESFTISEAGPVWEPDVAALGNVALIVWRGEPPGIYGMRIRLSDGSALDESPIPISVDPGIHSSPVIATNGEEFLVAWVEARPGERRFVRTTAVTRDGTVREPGGHRVTGTADAESGPQLTPNGSGYVLVLTAVWVDGDDVQVHACFLDERGELIDVPSIVTRNSDVVSATGVSAVDDDFVVATQIEGRAQVYRIEAGGDVLRIGWPYDGPLHSDDKIRRLRLETADDTTRAFWIDVDDDGNDDDLEGNEVQLMSRPMSPDWELGAHTSLAYRSRIERFDVLHDGLDWIAAAVTGSELIIARVTTDGAPLDLRGRATPSTALGVSLVRVGTRVLLLEASETLRGRWIAFGDGIPDRGDVCPTVADPEQEDSDGNGIGDRCQDSDGDGFLDTEDTCPLVPDIAQIDLDSDGVGAACDADDDADDVDDLFDNCPLVANAEQADFDVDGMGDACDWDDDCDGTPDTFDPAPLAVEAWADADGDGIGATCDSDRDGDGVPNATDNCPDVSNPGQENFDFDALGNACDERGRRSIRLNMGRR